MFCWFASDRLLFGISALSFVTAVAAVDGSALSSGLPRAQGTSGFADQQIRSSARPGEATGFLLGRTLDGDTRQPISGALVTLATLADAAGRPAPRSRTVQSNAPPTRTVVTNGDGYWLFRDVTSGRYSVSATAVGYLPGGYLRRGPEDARVHPLELRDGERRADLEVRLWKLGSISGAVFDETGGPAVGATVTILRREYRSGRLKLVHAATAKTDDRGWYAAGGLPPADYIIGIRVTQSTIPVSLSQRFARALAAWTDPSRPLPFYVELRNNGVTSPRGTGYRIGDWIRQISDTTMVGYTPPPPQSDGRVPAYPSTYFGNADSPATSTAITLRAGEDRRGVDLTLRLVESVRVSGKLLGPDGPVHDLGVHLVSPGTEELGSAFGFDAAATVSDSQGAFTFLGVPPGQYLLRATRSRIAPVPGKPAAPILSAEQMVTVDNSDVNELLVTLRPGLKMTGRVQFSGDQVPPQKMPPITIGLRSVVTGIMERGAMTVVAPDGTFTTDGNLPGRYFVEVWPPPGWAVRSAMFEGRNVADEPVDLLSSGANDVIVTLTDNISRLSGTVTTEAGSPDSQARVIVFPADSDGWRRGDFNVRRTRQLPARADGTFVFENIPPGVYYVVGVHDAVASEWSNPTVLEQLVSAASRVTIAEGDNKTVALRRSVAK